MNILKYLRTKLEGLIKGKQNKRLISGKVESKGGITEERRSKEKDFKTRTYHDPVYSRSSIFYTILKKHYNLSEDFAKNVILQETLKSAIERKISNKSRWIDINSLNVDKILEILEDGKDNVPDYCIDKLVSDMERSGTFNAINFLVFGKNEYPSMFDALTK